MKILQIIYSLSSGGAERFVVDLCNELSNQGHEVYLCTLRDDTVKNQGFYKNDISNEVNYINLKLPEGFRLSNIKAINDVIREVRPNIVHCHQNLVNYIFPITLYKKNIKFFHTIHNDAPTEVKNKFEYLIRKVFYSTNKVKAITISKETSNSFLKYYKCEKNVEIYNGCKTPLISKDINDVLTYINNLRINSDFVFLHIGRCAIQKNQKMLISVFNRLKAEGVKVTLLIIGSGFESELGNELKSLANENIQFLGEKHYVADYLINADAFCLSSIHEGMPITLIEALACGCIPICTPVGGIVDTISDGVNGFISNSTTEEDYYNSIKKFINNTSLVKKDNLIKYYNERFTMFECADRHIKLYMEN